MHDSCCCCNIPGNNILVLPAELVAETADSAVLAAGLEPQHPEGLRDDHALLAIVRRGHALEELETLKSCRAASSLVGDHTADGPVENLGRCAVVEGAGLFRVDDVAFVKEVVVPQLYKCTESDLPHIHCKRVNAPCCGRSCRKC